MIKKEAAKLDIHRKNKEDKNNIEILKNMKKGQLVAKTIFDVLVSKIEADIASAQDFLEAGSAKDYAITRKLLD